MKFGFDWPSDFREEDFDNGGQQTATMDIKGWLSYKLTL